MEEFKEFVIGLRKIESDIPFLIIIKEHPPNYLEGYVKMIIDLRFDEDKSNAYYGEIKKIVCSFFNFYTACIAYVEEKIERYSLDFKYDKMMELYKNTLNVNDGRMKTFKRDYTPSSPKEEMDFNQAQSDYCEFRQKLEEFGTYLANLRKPDQIEAFAKSHFHTCIEKTAAMCDYAHIFISKMIYARVKLIRDSLLDIAHRIRRNSKEFNERYENILCNLYDDMYDLNKESLIISRRQETSITETAEIEKKINMIRDKIENYGNIDTTQRRLKMETEYWTKQLEEFDYINSIIVKVKVALDKMIAEEKIHKKYETTELPGSKVTCWDTIGENFRLMKEDLEVKYTRSCRSLITFFACRGFNRLMYADAVGLYYVDEYGHQNYITHYGAKFFHANCDGELLENLENDKYYFDENGRYIIEDGEKIFQLAPCTNKYKQTPDGLFYKYLYCHCKLHCSKNVMDQTCGYDLLDRKDVVILPTVENIDIRKTLDTETVLYLWQSFGWILPEVLYQVGTAQSRNPIHYFGHALLSKKYNLTEKQISQMKEETMKFAYDIYEKRKNKSKEATLAWKAKQAKPCKSEDLDTTEQDVAFAAHQDDQQFITDNFYD